MIGLIRELLSAARDGYLDAMQDAGPGQPGKNRGERAGLVGRESSHFSAVAPPGTQQVEPADNFWFAPAIPVQSPTGEVRVRRAQPDDV